MPDVGVLNLQIRDDSSKAAEGLERLAGALERVRSAVNGAKLGAVAAQISKIQKAVAEMGNSGTAEHINKLAFALDRLKAAGNFKMPNVKDIEKYQKTMLSLQEATQDAGAGAGKNASGFVQFEREVQESADGISTALANIAPPHSFETVVENVEEARTSFAELREGAIEAEGSVGDAVVEVKKAAESMQEAAAGGAGAAANWSFRWSPRGENNAFSAALRGEMGEKTQQWAQTEAIGRARREASKLEEMLQKVKQTYGETSQQAQAVAEALEVQRKIISDMQQALSSQQNGNPAQAAAQAAQAQAAAQVAPIQAAQQAQTALATTMQQTAQGSAASGAMQAVAQQTQSVATSADDATSSVRSLNLGLDGLKAAAKNTNLGGLLSQLMRVAKMRFLRAVVKEVAEGFKEGLENMYHYSEKVGGSFAPSMDAAASALLQMKNSIGAAAAPLIEMLIPYLQQLISWFITGINYLNQFLALLRGQATWTKATPTTAKAFDNVKKSAKGASAAVKDLLADWDELNIIQSDSGGGGGGGGAKAMADYLSMFEQVSRFDNIFGAIQEQFGSVWELVKRIGLAILGWKFSSVFTGVLGALGSLVAAGAIIDLVFNVSEMMSKQYAKTGNIGWLVGDVLTTILGAALATKVLTPILGGAAASVAIPLTFAVSAGATIKALIENTDISALDERSIKLAATAALEDGAAAGSLFYLTGAGTLGKSLAVGGGTAILTFGIAIALKAVSGVAKDGKINREDLEATIAGSALIGAGLALTEVALGGGVATAIALGSGAAIITLGALIAIEAIIASKPKGVQWGNARLTAEEIKKYVNGTIFKTSPQVTIDLANAKIQDAETAKQNLQAKVDEVMGTFESIKLGINEDESFENLKKEIFDEGGLMAKFKDYAKTQQTLVKTAIKLVPTTDEKGSDTSAETWKNSSAAWQVLNNEMTSLGKELTAALDKGYKESLDGFVSEETAATIERLTNMILNVTDAVTSGKERAAIMLKLNKGIADMSHETVDEFLDIFESTKKELQDSMRKSQESAYEGQMGLYYALMELATGTDNEKDRKKFEDAANKAYESAQAIFKDMEERIAHAADDMVNDEEMQKIRDSLLGMITGAVTVDKNALSAAMRNSFGDMWWQEDMWPMLFGENGEASPEAKSRAEALMRDAVTNAFGESDANTLLRAVDAGILKYSDFFSTALIQELGKNLGMSNANTAVQEAWKNFMRKEFGLDSGEVLSAVLDPDELGGAGGSDLISDETAMSLMELAQSMFGVGWVEPVTVPAGEVIAEVEVGFSVIKDPSGPTLEGAIMDSVLSGGQSSKELEATAKEFGLTFEELRNAVNRDLLTNEQLARFDAAMDEFDRLGKLKPDPPMFSIEWVQNATNTVAAEYEKMAERIRKAVEELNSIQMNFNLGGLVGGFMINMPMKYASGGFPDSGQLFMARENGMNEFVGAMGGRSVVANNGQIVDGITQGVASGQSEQTSLLRRQNELLVALLNKKWVGEVRASSGIGRVNAAAADAYKKVTG